MKENKTQLENQKRLDFLYRNHHSWLMACSFNISRNVEISEDLVSDLYLYLAEKCSPKLWFLESFNLLYCHSFLKTRYINKIKINNRFNPISDTYDVEDTPYDRDFDENMETAYKEIITQFSELQKTPLWASAKLAEMYYLNPKNTFDSLATFETESVLGLRHHIDNGPAEHSQQLVGWFRRVDQRPQNIEYSALPFFSQGLSHWYNFLKRWVKGGSKHEAESQLLHRSLQNSVIGPDIDPYGLQKIRASALRCNRSIPMLENRNPGCRYDKRYGGANVKCMLLIPPSSANVDRPGAPFIQSRISSKLPITSGKSRNFLKRFSLKSEFCKKIRFLDGVLLR